jgi:hypothetical protein
VRRRLLPSISLSLSPSLSFSLSLFLSLSLSRWRTLHIAWYATQPAESIVLSYRNITLTYLPSTYLPSTYLPSGRRRWHQVSKTVRQSVITRCVRQQKERERGRSWERKRGRQSIRDLWSALKNTILYTTMSYLCNSSDQHEVKFSLQYV